MKNEKIKDFPGAEIAANLIKNASFAEVKKRHFIIEGQKYYMSALQHQALNVELKKIGF